MFLIADIPNELNRSALLTRGADFLGRPCIGLLVPTPQGLQMLGTPGWRMGEAIGVLVERDGRRVFQAKQDVVEATADRLKTLRRFRAELEELLAAGG